MFFGVKETLNTSNVFRKMFLELHTLRDFIALFTNYNKLYVIILKNFQSYIKTLSIHIKIIKNFSWNHLSCQSWFCKMKRKHISTLRLHLYWNSNDIRKFPWYFQFALPFILNMFIVVIVLFKVNKMYVYQGIFPNIIHSITPSIAYENRTLKVELNHKATRE